MYTGKNFAEKNFAKLKNSEICGNKLHKRLRLSKETVADDKIYKRSNVKVI